MSQNFASAHGIETPHLPLRGRQRSGAHVSTRECRWSMLMWCACWHSLTRVSRRCVNKSRGFAPTIVPSCRGTQSVLFVRARSPVMRGVLEYWSTPARYPRGWVYAFVRESFGRYGATSFERVQVRRGRLRREKAEDTIYLLEMFWFDENFFAGPSGGQLKIGGNAVADRQRASRVLTLKRAGVVSGQASVTQLPLVVQRDSVLPDVEFVELFLQERSEGYSSRISLYENEGWDEPRDEVGPWRTMSGHSRDGCVDEREVPELDWRLRLLPTIFDNRLVEV